MAHIEKPRYNKTTGDWSVRVIHYNGGQRRTLSLAGYESDLEAATAAEHEANQLEREKFIGQLGQSPDPSEVGDVMTGGELVEHWNEHYVQVYLTGSTRANYPAWAARYFTPYWGQRVIGLQGRAQGREYVTWLLKEIRNSMGERGALPKDPHDAEMAGVPMANRVLTMAKSVFTYALENSWISERQHPLRDARGTAGRRGGRNFELAYVPDRTRSDLAVPPELVEAIRAVISRGHPERVRLRDQAIVELIGHCCLRQQDLWEASWWRFIDEETSQIRKRVALARERGTQIARKSESSEREPRIWEPTRRTLSELYLAMGRPNLDQLAFPGVKENGSPLMRRNWQRSHWKPALELVGKLTVETARRRLRDEETGKEAPVDAPRFVEAVKVLTPHMTRRCGSSMMGYAGLPNFVALAQMGHNQRENKTLIRYYLRAYEEGEDAIVRVPVDEQITRARALYSGKTLAKALKLAAAG